jgi:hypothetical protein
MKALLLGAVAGVSLGTCLSLVMPEDENHTSFTFEQNVGLSNNSKKPTKLRIGEQIFSAYEIDDERVLKSLAPKANLLENIGELYARVTTKFDIEDSLKNFQVE